jgi:hypothetical protein
MRRAPAWAWRLAAPVLLGLLAACSSAPPPADWQMNARSGLDRATQAWLSGNSRLEDLEFGRARAEIARTGRPELVARAELLRCATRVASLVFEACAGFEALAQDASAEDRAYARYLAGQATPTDVPLLPPQHRAAAAGAAIDPGALPDPLSRLVAAGVSMRRAAASAAVARMAIDSASSQGWSRPLLAWLTVALRGAESAGDEAAAAALRRRIALVTAAPATPAALP